MHRRLGQSVKKRIRRDMEKMPLFRNWAINRRFKIERTLLKGGRLATKDNVSVIHFSVNKAATQYTKRIMLRCGLENGLLPVRMSDYAWYKDGFPYLHTLSRKQVAPYVHIFRPHGYLYTVFGGLVEGIPNIGDYRSVIMIRDPRDILVSEYYSYSKSHALPASSVKRAEFEAFRRKVNTQTVDEYAMEASERLNFRFERYMAIKEASMSICVLKYEDMIADFPTWLNKLLVHCQWEISVNLREQLIREAQQGRLKKGEDVKSHLRQIVPGDHRRKLQPETIRSLNASMSTVLRGFDYQI